MALELIIDDNVRMPFVRFERVPFEDKQASLAAGHYVAVDVDMAYITPPYSKDVMKYKAKQWFANLEMDCSNNRISREWVNQYKQQYEYWLKGQEMPLSGIPIKGWGVISPAQQETLIKMHVLTVEQLAAITDEGMRRVGMGASELKNKAVAWLKTLEKSGKLTLEMSKLQSENTQLKDNQAILEQKIAELTMLVNAKMAIEDQNIIQNNIGIDDLMVD